MSASFCHNMAIFDKCEHENAFDPAHEVSIPGLTKRRIFGSAMKYSKILYDFYNDKENPTVEDKIR